MTSPTYTIISEYEGRFRLLHVDLYRIDSDEEYLQLGIEDEANTRTIVVVEWPERAAAALPDDAFRIDIKIESGSSRLLDLPDALAHGWGE